MSKLELPLWSAGVVITVVSPLVSVISKQTFLYWLVFNILVWIVIGIVYGVEYFIKKKYVIEFPIKKKKGGSNENRNNI